jgi:hypothetical protein
VVSKGLTNDLFINHKVWAKFSDEEMDAYRQAVFTYYREAGFPLFPTDRAYREKEYKKLMKYDFTQCVDHDRRTINQTMHGLALAWSYMPHSWNVVCNGKLTPWQVFHDDDLLMKCIIKRTTFGANMSDNGLRKIMKLFTGTQCVSNFRPTAAAGVYDWFCQPDNVVWDMSCGFGGRLLGAHMAGVKYIGTDPSTPTFNGLCQMNEDFDLNGEIHQCGSEVFLPDKNSLDFCFTSPPYFDTEKYTDEETQSYMAFPSKDAWLDGFLLKTFENCHYGLKKGKLMAVNVANTKHFPDFEQKTIDCGTDAGFNLISTWNLALSNPTMKSTKQVYKYEPIFIFQK